MRLPNEADFTRVASELLSPKEVNRYLANELLFSMYVLLKTTNDETLEKDILQRSLASIQDRDIFIRALFSYWANTSQTLHNKWNKLYGLPNTQQVIFEPTKTGWYSPLEQHYPITQPCDNDTAMPDPLLMGMHTWLETAVDSKDISLIPQLIACLNHPESVCQDTAIKMLGAISYNTNAIEIFKPALTAMQQRIKDNGHYCNPFIDGMTIVNIIGNNIDAWLEMANQITPDSNINTVQGYCSTFSLIPNPSQELIDTLLTICTTIPQQKDKKLYNLLICVAELANKRQYRCDDVRTIVLPLITADAYMLRSAIAIALGYVGHFPQDETLLIQLSKDSDLWVRTCAHRAARSITTPSPELVEATAQDLDEYGLCDGMPHDDAVETLVGWGMQISAAFTHIKRWLTAAAEDPSYYEIFNEQELTLIENLGDDARSLLPLLQKYYNFYITDDDNSYQNESDENDPDFPQNVIEAFTITRERLHTGIADLQAIDDNDKNLDHETLAAIKDWEKNISPLIEQLLIRTEQGEKTVDTDTYIQMKRLLKEGENLLIELITKSTTNMFGDLELTIGDDEETNIYNENLRLFFMKEMGIDDIGTPDFTDSSYIESNERLLLLINKLQR